ncbi:MAG: bifunctional demethylmenaquinone methyltransferase/2-methoxy-6-polyprenyl-1,4-benzoquinol methylase UbiE [Nitratiruptor sp.]|nr:bifunctional demethylmenaquinone methyltransferase/2-methoxy-6-polyprenyl-1,4-benzoquinol methylase UbiE [Nitratiruptor sp.]NPA82870.1 bifunctional demethylmenaquinone methyltransferase/2-methoxy-6-polyprenyl-1,4-benzoquinol methylase UbiE [Campylobacterota bacterium]
MDNKQQEIVSMFDRIAKSYDLTNRVLSFGSDLLWRKEACRLAYRLAGKEDIEKIVDVACGTGDMLRFWAEEAKRARIRIGELIGVDPSANMLAIARRKLPQATFIQGYAQQLPLEGGQADLVSITYGIRNVTQRLQALQEFYRILKPGGLLLILEFTKRPRTTPLDRLVEWYMKGILPKVGGLLSGNFEAYRYLPDSIDHFLTTQQLLEELERSGFTPLKTKSFAFGVSTLFIARKDG